ncbi:hypothetical protein CPter91_1537 [Collimonas pratensis]|uniref:Uncharacterized protein n=1 Tax=Collimonas pratensis TaxID=279113 RepID=A0A127Q1P5_9BURK|nr:hypothetical protein CPter91_1537 [Collimonas pratensis]
MPDFFHVFDAKHANRRMNQAALFKALNNAASQHYSNP